MNRMYFGPLDCPCALLPQYLERKNMAFSYWEAHEWLDNCDLCIVGAGLVGLSAAIRARALQPHWRITILDRHPFSGGGSSRNAGFACFGSTSELQEDRRVLGDHDALTLVKKRLTGLNLLRQTLGDKAIGYEPCGSMELFLQNGATSYRPPTADDLEDLNAWIAPATQSDTTFSVCALHSIPGVSPEHLSAAIASPMEGSIDTGRMLNSLIKKAQLSDIKVVNGCHVTDFIHSPTPRLRLSDKPDNGEWIEPERVIIATNAFAQELLPRADVRPVANEVLVTAPIAGLNIQGTFHLDAGYLYARNIGNRMLIGGGRHWGLDDPDATRVKLMEVLHRIWPATLRTDVTHQWTGMLGIGKDRMPIQARITPRVQAAIRLGGMGIAMGMSLGFEAANQLLEHPLE